MALPNINSYQTDTTKVRVMDKPEYISTKEAAKILKVGSTQAVRYLMEQYPDKLPGYNVGSEAQPRWVLRREDVLRFQYERSDEL